MTYANPLDRPSHRELASQMQTYLPSIKTLLTHSENIPRVTSDSSQPSSSQQTLSFEELFTDLSV